MISIIIISKLKYGEKSKLLFTDTDSLCYEIESKDAFRVG